MAAWAGRGYLRELRQIFTGIGRLAERGFGFEDLNRAVIGATLKAADRIRPLQTGLLNWNIFGILGGLLIVLAWLAWGSVQGR
jgi:NADH-quinone oxidoreductase subunit L